MLLGNTCYMAMLEYTGNGTIQQMAVMSINAASFVASYVPENSWYISP